MGGKLALHAIGTDPLLFEEAEADRIAGIGEVREMADEIDRLSTRAARLKAELREVAHVAGRKGGSLDLCEWCEGTGRAWWLGVGRKCPYCDGRGLVIREDGE